VLVGDKSLSFCKDTNFLGEHQTGLVSCWQKMFDLGNMGNDPSQNEHCGEYGQVLSKTQVSITAYRSYFHQCSSVEEVHFGVTIIF